MHNAERPDEAFESIFNGPININYLVNGDTISPDLPLCYNLGLRPTNLFMTSLFVFFNRKRALLASCMCLVLPILIAGQEADKANAKPEPAKTPAVSAKDAAKNPTAEQVVETVIFIYGLGGGRELLKQIRRTTIERGKTTVINTEGQKEQASYQRWVTRGEKLANEKIRVELELPTARYSLVYSDEKTFGIFNDAVFTPREDAARSFVNQIFYGLDSLLRYKENESAIELAGRDKIGGVDFHLVDLTDKQGRTMRFYVSVKTFRVMMLDYEDGGTKYRRRYYDYNNAQGTLVPYRTVLFAGDKVVEETDIGTVTFGQKIDENLFTVAAS
ncbi:MAG: hypothetical protein IPM25_08445 [Chloracidobacterium sp.]|nr:hypothetical protein [Chloracidobacterium sp.]